MRERSSHWSTYWSSHRSSRIALWLRAGVFYLLCVGWLSSTFAVPPDHVDEALRLMCERGLAHAAQEYCRAQVGLHSEQPALRSRWTMRQMECVCQTALSVRGDSEQSWAEVATIEADYRREFPTDARLPWLAWQLARAELLRSQQALAKWLATPAAQQHRELALQCVRRVLAELDEVEADIKLRLPLSDARNATSRNQAPSSELHSLSIDCTLLRCEALLVRSKSYPDDSPDRLAALADVDRIAGEMLLRAPQDWPARDELLVARAAAGLEIGKRAESEKMLLAIVHEQPVEAAASDDPNRQAALPGERARIRAGSILIESLCANNDLSAAERVLQTLASNFKGPEVELAQIRVQLARLDKLSAAERSDALRSVVDHAKQLGQQYGGYWRNRAEALLIGPRMTQTPDGGGDLQLAQDLLAVEVRQLLAGGKAAEAITKLRSASENALAAGHAAEALEYAVQAAALLQRDKQWLSAADVLAPAAVAASESSKAAAAHVLAAWCLAQALQAKPQESELQRRYERTLQEQLARWPDADETLRSEEFLRKWLDSHKRFVDLAAMWRQRAASGDQAERRTRALQQWLDTILSKLPVAQAKEERDKLIKDLADGRFVALERPATTILLAATMLTEPLTQTEAETLTGMKMPSHWSDESIEHQALLSSLLVLAAARRGDVTASQNSLQLLPFEQLTSVVTLAWTKAIVEALDEMSAQQVTAWSVVAQQIPWMPSEELQRNATLHMIGLRLRMMRGGAENETSALLDEMKRLIDKHPRDAGLQLSYAAALAQSDEKRFEDAIQILKRVAFGSSKESDNRLRARWLELRWRAARGETRAARDVAALTLQGSSISDNWWKQRFEAYAKPK